MATDCEYDFVAPPECPVFTPTSEEFKDAMAYLEKIKPIAEEAGIIKIRPPPDWQPPFAVDVDRLKFTPRIQRLNELEAHTRIKLNFLDQVAKFWDLQGSTLKIPLVDKRALDLYTLKKYVKKEGGMEIVTQEKKWQKVATDMGFNPQNKNIANLLKAHYERILYPLDVFEEQEEKKNQAIKEEIKEENPDGKEYKPHNIPSRMGMKVPSEKAGRRTGRMNGAGSGPEETNNTGTKTPTKTSPAKTDPAAPVANGNDKTNSFSKELARLQFFGAGPKMAGIPTDKTTKEKTRGMKLNFEYDPLARYMCQNCGKGDAEEQMLLCDGCDDSYHTFCLMPPLAEIPKGDWRCPKCIAAEVSKPMEAFGFEQAQKEYTLQTFGEMADQFKSDYFNMPVHLIPTSLVEKEYWRILENIDEDVMVEYGADLHSMDHGSGFPQMTSKNLSKEDEIYAKSEWNLNKLPVVANSILKMIDVDISGMKVPWLYVGMCFSTFCWHTEDHWTPSINYLHWGEPKTWYGISSKHAEKAEAVMRQSAKELFAGQPDLLHHIVTTMNPNVLQAHGVPVVRTDQQAGEFIVTFPRAYHAGFNQGFNLAEAVNYAPPCWLEMGRKCVEHYSFMRRYCVFCHDELVCKMATQAEKLTLPVAASCYKDMVQMVEQERDLRRALLEGGVTEAEREAFELLPDDERQCAICKTTCFLSALTSLENKESNEIVCLRHFKSMECEPDKLVLRYRYTLDELAVLLQGVKARAECYEIWVDKVKEALEAKGDDRMEFDDMKELLEEAQTRKYPESELLEALHLTVDEAEKCQTVANQLGNKKVRTRTRGVLDAKSRLTVEELQLFSSQLDTLPVKVSGKECVTQLLDQVQKFQESANAMLSKSKSQDLEDLKKLIETGSALDVDLQELNDLKGKAKELEWLDEAKEIMDDPMGDSTDHIKQVIETGMELAPSPKVEKLLGELSGLLTQVESWENRAKSCLASKPRLSLSELEKLIKDGDNISEGLPSLQTLKDSAKKAKEWQAKAAELKKHPDHKSYIELLETLVARGRPLPVKLEALAGLETQVAAGRAWRERTARVFLKKNCNAQLLDVLCPRVDLGSGEGRRKAKKAGLRNEELSGIQHPIFQGLTQKEMLDRKVISKAFKDAEIKEIQAIKELRQNKLASSTDSSEDSESAASTQTPKKASTVKFECEVCLKNFHPSHVPFPKNSPKDQPTSLHDIKFLCPGCLRSRRPRIELILSLLMNYEKLGVKLPEGEALTYLTDRALAWQQRAEKLLRVDEVARELGKIREKVAEKQQKKAEASEASAEGESESDSDVDGTTKLAVGKKVPEVRLSGKVQTQLEELMLEGDLLEVTLDENTQIWKLLQATEPRRSRKYPDLNQLEAELESAREEKMRARKKRKLDQANQATAEAKKAKLDDKTEGGPGTGKKRKGGNRTRKNQDMEEDLEEEEEQEDCSAKPKCQKPVGKEVHWVQCDGCELWLHLNCIGLKPEQVSEEEEFICRDCKPASKKGKAK